MAIFNAYTKFDANKIVEIGNANETIDPLERTEIPGGYLVSDSNGHEVELLGSLTTNASGLSFSGGKINSVSQSNDGLDYFSITGLNHNINVNFYDSGYNLDGQTLYGFQAETAYWLNGNDKVYGSQSSDVLSGYAGNDLMYGKNGNDTLKGWSGNDKLNGDAGNDKLYGGSGQDVLTGGLGIDTLFGGSKDGVKDVFDFNNASESAKGTSRDKIYDFVRGIDKIDLAGIDANASINKAGDQAFVFSNMTAKANSVWYKAGNVDGLASTSDVIVYGDVNGDTVADFEIGLVGVNKVAATDFVL